MSGRYEILDILAQDGDGVAFHAEDRETGHEVVLRRFFPFGADGGGLVDEERAAYEIAVRRLMQVSHPALRNVLDGGTDPVDGMPFLVTEWIEGRPLSERLAERELSPPSAKALIDLALETCQVLSQTFQEESVWIETSTDSILLGPSGQERQVTFRISPLRWLGEDQSRKGLRSLLRLGEESTGWNRRMLSDSAGEGLGAWIKALRKNPDQWSLEQARYALHHGPDSLATAPKSEIRSSAPISPAHATIPAQTTPPVLASKDRTNWWPWIAASVLTTLATAFVLWQAFRPRDEPPPPVVAEAKAADGAPAADDAAEPATAAPGMSAAERASARAAQLAQEVEEIAEIPEAGTAGMASPELNARLIEVGKQLRDNIGKQTRIEARIYSVRPSNSGKTLYIEFGSSASPDAVCARHLTKSGVFTEERLREFIGKLVRVKGEIVHDPSGRIAIDIASEDGLKILES